MEAPESALQMDNPGGSTGRPLERRHEGSETPAQGDKIEKILACCHGTGKNDQLALLATSTSGLLDDEVRRLACMSEISLLDNLC